MSLPDAQIDEYGPDLQARSRRENIRLEHNLAALRDRIGSLGQDDMKQMNQRGVSDGLFR